MALLGCSRALGVSVSMVTSCVRLRRAIHTIVSITGISMSGPTTVETATMGMEAKDVKAMAMDSSKFLPVQWNPIVVAS